MFLKKTTFFGSVVKNNKAENQTKEDDIYTLYLTLTYNNLYDYSCFYFQEKQGAWGHRTWDSKEKGREWENKERGWGEKERGWEEKERGWGEKERGWNSSDYEKDSTSSDKKLLPSIYSR